MANKYTVDQFADEIRKKFPDRYDHWDNGKLTSLIVKNYPEYESWVEEPAPREEQYEKADKNFLKYATFQLASQSSKMYAGVTGIAAKAVDLTEKAFYGQLFPGAKYPEDHPATIEYKRLDRINQDGTDPDTGEKYKWYQRLQADVLREKSEEWRDWSKEQTKAYIRESPDVQAHLAWMAQDENQYSVDNFVKHPLDLVRRGMSDMGPSLGATIAAGLFGGPVGARAMGMMLEGSGAYDEAMEYLIEEKGLDVEAANDLASLTSTIYGYTAGMLEAYEANSILRGAGLNAEKGLVKNFVDVALKKIGKEGGEKSLSKTTRGLVRTADFVELVAVEGVQEWSQATADEVISNIYTKYADELGDVDFEEYAKRFVGDLKAAGTSEKAKKAFFSAFTGSLGFKATGRGAKGIGSSYRLSRDYIAGKRKPTSREIEEEGGPFLDEQPAPIISTSDGSDRRSDEAVLGMSLLNNNELSNPNEAEEGIIQAINIEADDNNAQSFVEEVKKNPFVLKEINKSFDRDGWLKNLTDSGAFDDAQLAQLSKAIPMPKVVKVKAAPVKSKPVLVKHTVQDSAPSKPAAIARSLTDRPGDINIRTEYALSWLQAGNKELAEQEIRTLENYEKRFGGRGSLKSQKDFNQAKANAVELRRRLEAPAIKKPAPTSFVNTTVAEIEESEVENLNDKLIHKKGYTEKLISMTKGFKKVSGKEITLEGTNRPFFVSKNSKGWSVSDTRTGISFSFQNDTMKDAIEYAENSIKEAKTKGIWESTIKKAEGKLKKPAPVIKPIQVDETQTITVFNPILHDEPLTYTVKEARKEIEDIGRSSAYLGEEGRQEQDIANEEIKLLNDAIKKLKVKPVQATGMPSFLKDAPVEETDDIDFQRPREGVRIADSKVLADRMVKRLKKQFPWIEARELEKVFDQKGKEVSGRAFKNVVEWSKGKATLDTIPHEYGHIYIKMMKKSKVVQEGMKKFKGEENLVQHMGDYYNNRMQNKGLYSRFKTWLRKFKLELKNFFGKSLSQKELGDLISERFYKAKIKKAPKKFSPEVDYQDLNIDQDDQSEAHDKQDNDYALDNTETDVRENTQKIYNKFLKSLGITDINRRSLAAIQEAVRSTPYDVWVSSSVKGILNKDVDLTSKQQVRLAKRFYHTVKSQGKTYSDDMAYDMYHNMQLEITKENEKNKSGRAVFDELTGTPSVESTLVNPKERFYRVTSKVKKYYNSKHAKEESGRKFTTRFLGDEIPAIKKLLKNTFILRKENLYEHNQSKNRNVRILATPYSFLRSKDIQAIIEAESIRYKNDPSSGFRKFPVYSKDGEDLWFQEINQDVISAAKDLKNYWQAQKDSGFISDAQFEKFIKQEGEDAENNIATFHFINTVYPGYMKDNWANVLKRLKIPFTPTVRNIDMPTSKAMYIEEERLSFSFPGQEITKANQIIADVAKEGKNFADGNTITGQSFFDRMDEHLGYDKDSGFIKTVMYDKVGDDVLMVKHQHSKADIGMSIYDGETLVATVNNRGDLEKPNGDIIDMIMTSDERKIGTGKFDESEFDVKGSAIGLIKYADGSKNTTKFPHQWLNYIPTALQNEITKVYINKDSRIINNIKKLFNIGEDYTRLNELVKSLDKMLPDEISPVLNNFIDLGSGFHPATSTSLSTIATRSFLQPAMAMAGQEGTSAYLAPNYKGDLAENEVAISMANAEPLKKMYRDYVRKEAEKNGEKVKNIPVSEEILNNWLNTSPAIKVLVTRNPVPHLNGVVYLTIKRVHSKNNVAELHKDITFRLLEGDYDGDSITIEFPLDKIKPIYQKFFTSPEYLSEITGLDMDSYKKEQITDMTNTSERLDIIDQLTQGSQAISEIANLASYYNSVKNSISQVTFQQGDEQYSIGPTTQDIMLPNGDLVSPNKALRIYLQAAADNGKYLILSDWKYYQKNLLKQFFSITNHQTNEINNFRDYSAKNKSVSRETNAFQNITKINQLWKVFENDVYNLYKIPNSLRNGRAPFTDGIAGTRLTLSQYIDQSKLYQDFLKDRKSFIIDNVSYERQEKANKLSKYIYSYDIVNVKSPKEGKHIDTREYLTGSLYSIYKNFSDIGKIDPYQYIGMANEMAHYASLERIENNKRLANKDSKESEVGRIYADSLFRDIMKVSKYGRSKFQPNTWSQSDWIQPVVDKYSKKFMQLGDQERLFATYWYLEAMSDDSYYDDDQFKGTDFKYLTPTEIYATLPPSVDSKKNKQGLNLLDHRVLKGYFNEYNKILTSSTSKEAIENTRSIKEVNKLCQ